MHQSATTPETHRGLYVVIAGACSSGINLKLTKQTRPVTIRQTKPPVVQGVSEPSNIHHQSLSIITRTFQARQKLLGRCILVAVGAAAIAAIHIRRRHNFRLCLDPRQSARYFRQQRRRTAEKAHCLPPVSLPHYQRECPQIQMDFRPINCSVASVAPAEHPVESRGTSAAAAARYRQMDGRYRNPGARVFVFVGDRTSRIWAMIIVVVVDDLM